MRPDENILYRRLVEHMNEAVWMGDKDERTVYANPKFCELMERTQKEMLGRESYEFWDLESAKRVRQVNTAERRKGVASSYEGTLVSKSGKKIPVLLSGTPLPDGSTIGIMTDLRKLKESERQEKLLGSALQHALDAIVILDADGTIRSWNKGAKIAFGHSSATIIGRCIDELFPLEHVSELLKESGRTHNVELKGRHKGGSVLTLSATLTSVDDDTSAPVWLFIGRNISSQRLFEEELATRYEKLREAYNKFGIARRQMDYVFELLDLCIGRENPQLVADFIVNSVVMLTRIDACSLRRYDPSRQTLTMLSSFGMSDDWKGKKVLKYSDSVVKRAFAKRTPLKVVDIAADPSYHSKNLARKSNFTSMLSIPLIFRDELLGSLSLYTGPDKRLEIFENDFIEKYAQAVSLVLHSITPDPA